MATVTGNFSGNPNPDAIKDEDIVENFNFMQAVADTPILIGKNVTLRGSGNLINCLLHKGIKLESSFNTSKKSCCSHVHPSWKSLPVCPEYCDHFERDEINDVTGEVEHVYEDQPL